MDLSIFPCNDLREIHLIKFIINDQDDFIKMLDYFDMVEDEVEDEVVIHPLGEKRYYCVIHGEIRVYNQPNFYYEDELCKEIDLYPEFIKKPNLVFKL